MNLGVLSAAGAMVEVVLGCGTYLLFSPVPGAVPAGPRQAGGVLVGPDPWSETMLSCHPGACACKASPLEADQAEDQVMAPLGCSHLHTALVPRAGSVSLCPAPAWLWGPGSGKGRR